MAALIAMAAAHTDRASRQSNVSAEVDAVTGYIQNIDELREAEYPSLRETVYLDHAGTTLYAKSLISKYADELTSNLFGNPHSASAASQLSTRRIDDTRLQVLRFFNADPGEFEVIFVANATAAIKLVADAFRDADSGFWYGYHGEAHTSLVGVRQLAAGGSKCFKDDEDVQSWISSLCECDTGNAHELQLFGYPGQSNMTGHKPPLAWCKEIRDSAKTTGKALYTLYDAAGLLSTSAMDLSDAASAPDFIAMSFYKIFGFPDLGALVVRKQSEHVLRGRKYFAGGTVEVVTTTGIPQHMMKESLHSRLEDGTLPFHNILALQLAMNTHIQLYGSTPNISRHTFWLAQKTYRSLIALRHHIGTPVCKVYGSSWDSENPRTQGPVIAFNLFDSEGGCVATSELEKLGIIKGIQFRTGGLCNPGGTANHLNLSPEQQQANHDAGHRCDNGQDLIDGSPTGSIRISFGAMSSVRDAEAFMNFIEEYYVEKEPIFSPQPAELSPGPSYVVESLSVYPIKSCAAFRVPSDTLWEVKAKGLLWDREWCLVHEGTRTSLSQKRYPRMALLQPRFDLERRMLIVAHGIPGTTRNQLEISLDHSTDSGSDGHTANFCQSSSICGEQVDVEIYTAKYITTFFTEALGVPCTLARYPEIGPVRLAKPRVPHDVPTRSPAALERSIMLSNESPILLVSRSSVNRLNEQIKENGSVGKAVSADSFRGNIVVAEELCGGQAESPYDEDDWHSLVIGADAENQFEVMGPCQRCQMICVDQKSAQRRQEPFSTLSKTRRRDGKVYFGIHMCLAQPASDQNRRFVQIGDQVRVTR